MHNVFKTVYYIAKKPSLIIHYVQNYREMADISIMFFT